MLPPFHCLPPPPPPPGAPRALPLHGLQREDQGRALPPPGQSSSFSPPPPLPPSPPSFLQLWPQTQSSLMKPDQCH